MKKAGLSLGFILLCFSLSPVVFAVELIENGGFETGDFSGWTITGDPDQIFGLRPPPRNYSGNWGAFFGSINDFNYLSQTIATIPGTSYDLSFWLKLSEDPGTTERDSEMYLWWNDVMLLHFLDANPFDYSLMHFPELIAVDTSSEIRFGFLNPPGQWWIDNISVTPTVPEPTSLLLLGTGLGVIGLGAWRRRK